MSCGSSRRPRGPGAAHLAGEALVAPRPLFGETGRVVLGDDIGPLLDGGELRIGQPGGTAEDRALTLDGRDRVLAVRPCKRGQLAGGLAFRPLAEDPGHRFAVRLEAVAHGDLIALGLRLRVPRLDLRRHRIEELSGMDRPVLHDIGRNGGDGFRVERFGRRTLSRFPEEELDRIGHHPSVDQALAGRRPGPAIGIEIPFAQAALLGDRARERHGLGHSVHLVRCRLHGVELLGQLDGGLGEAHGLARHPGVLVGHLLARVLPQPHALVRRPGSACPESAGRTL